MIACLGSASPLVSQFQKGNLTVPAQYLLQPPQANQKPPRPPIEVEVHGFVVALPGFWGDVNKQRAR